MTAQAVIKASSAFGVPLSARQLLSYIKANIHDLSVEDLELLSWRATWLARARKNQVPPDGMWDIWMVMAGRGFGKTRVGAEWICWAAASQPETRWAVVAPTSNDIREVCIEGESGIINVVPPSLIETYNRSLSEVVFTNGSRIKGFSAQEADRLRGPQHHGAWLDEVGAFGSDMKDPADASRKARDAMDMLKFGLRLGTHPQMVMTTTPRPVPHIREIVKKSVENPAKVIVVRGSTYENKQNLAPSFFDQIAQYEGTALGRQEIHAELIDPEESGIIKRSWFKLWPARNPLPRFEFVVQSYDTAYTEKTTNDPTGCQTWGVFEHEGQMNVLLCDAWTEHLTFDPLVAKMRESYDALYGEPGRKPDVVLIEDKGSGISVRQVLNGLGVPVRAYNPGKADKTQRLHAVSHLIANGKCWVPESSLRPKHARDWCDPMLEQICAFPLVDHDEHVDVLSQMLALVRDQGWLEITKYKDEAEVVELDYYREKKRKENPYAA